MLWPAPLDQQRLTLPGAAATTIAGQPRHAEPNPQHTMLRGGVDRAVAMTGGSGLSKPVPGRRR